MAKLIDIIWKGLVALVGAAAIGALIWAVLYVAVPNIKDNTDKMFKWGDYAVIEETEDETPEDEPLEDETPEDDANGENVTTSARVRFNNQGLTIVIG